MFVDSLGQRVGTLVTLGFKAASVTDQVVAFQIADLNRCEVPCRSLLSRGEVDCNLTRLERA